MRDAYSYTSDEIRDNMFLLGETTPLTNLPLDWWEVTPVEGEATAQILETNPYICVSYISMKQEV